MPMTSIGFFDSIPVRAAWDEESAKRLVWASEISGVNTVIALIRGKNIYEVAEKHGNLCCKQCVAKRTGNGKFCTHCGAMFDR